MVLMPGATPEQALVASAMKGALANQKAVLVFTPAEGGESYIATFNVTGSLGEIHDSLLSAGLAFHTLAPTASGAQVIVYGSGQATIDAIDAAAGASNVSIVMGSGTFLGTSLSTGSDAEQRADAQAIYKRTIEGAGTVAGRNAATVWDSVSANWGAKLQALTKALARLLKFNANHDDLGRFTFGHGIKAVGERMATMVKDFWVGQSDIDTIPELTKAAPEDQKKLAEDATKINDAVDHGTELKDPGVKSEARIIEKVTEGREPAAVTDAVRLGFVTPDPALADQIVDALALRYAVADEGWKTTPAGYIDRKVLVRFSDGMIGEVQMWPPAMYEAKMPGGGEALYARARSLPAGSAEKAELVGQMRTLYERAQVTLPASWKSVISG